VAGLERALAHFGVALWGGDTVTGLAQAVLGLTAIGHVQPGQALSRRGAQPGDGLWVSGSIGDAGLGLDILTGRLQGPAALAKRYRLPMPRLALGQALAGQASAGMDVSDGLLIDADRLAAASGVGLAIDLGVMPVSPAARGVIGDGPDARLRLATAGDDYELLFTAPPGVDVSALAALAKTPVTRIGTVVAGAGLQLSCHGEALPLPARLGWEH
jgi:thiamine-monophosphate kinase